MILMILNPAVLFHIVESRSDEADSEIVYIVGRVKFRVSQQSRKRKSCRPLVFVLGQVAKDSGNTTIPLELLVLAFRHEVEVAKPLTIGWAGSKRMRPRAVENAATCFSCLSRESARASTARIWKRSVHDGHTKPQGHGSLAVRYRASGLSSYTAVTHCEI